MAAAAVSAVLLGLAAVGGLAAGAWWLLFPGSVPPQARYLPEDCDWFASLDWQRCVAGGMLGVPKETPGAALRERCRVFLANAELPHDAVERVSAGRAADGAGMVVAYRLTRPIAPEELFQKRAFRGTDKRRYARETIGGVPVYVYQTVAVAFPEAHVILSGDLFVLRRILTRWSRGVREPMKSLLERLDFSAASVSAATAVPKRLLTEHLQDCKQFEPAFTGTLDSCEFGETVRIERVLCTADQQAAESVQQSLKRSLASLAKMPKTSEAVRKALTSVQIDDVAQGARIAVTLREEQLSSPLLSNLAGIFN